MVADYQVATAGEDAPWDFAYNLNNTAGTVENRCGSVVPAPNITVGTSGGADGAYYNTTAGCSASSDANVPTPLVGDNGVPNDANAANNMLVAALGYYYVNEFAYGPYEPGCHNDQLYGWYVNLSTGELQLFTPVDGVATNVTRACLSADSLSTVTGTQKRQLKVLNKLYKLSKSAVKEVNGIPSQEGNIVEVCDCKGDKWLLYVNTASSQNGSALAACNYQFAIVATKLC